MGKTRSDQFDERSERRVDYVRRISGVIDRSGGSEESFGRGVDRIDLSWAFVVFVTVRREMSRDRGDYLCRVF
jgi:hypothetical protein